jgi:hypothetical protein
MSRLGEFAMLPVNTNAPSTGAALFVDRWPSAPATQAVAPDLSSAKSVSGRETSLSTPSSPGLFYHHTVSLNPATHDLIFRVIDVRSSQVVRQIPDEALLRMRIYARALADGRGMTEALTAANLEI